MRSDRLGTAYLLLLMPPLFWSGNAIVGKAMVGHIPPLAFSFWRWALAFALMFPFSVRHLLAYRREIRATWVTLLLLSVLGVGAYNSFQYLALQTSSAINVTLIGSALPIVMLPLSVVWLHERASWPEYLGVALSLAGVVVVVTRGDAAAVSQLQFARGDLIMLLAVITWAFYTSILKRHRPPLPSLPLLTIQVFFGALAILPFYLIERAQTGGFAANNQVCAAFGYVAIFPSALAYYSWEKGVARLGAQVAGLFVNLTPIFASILAVLLLGEQFHLYHALGLALLAGGLWLTSTGSAQNPNQESKIGIMEMKKMSSGNLRAIGHDPSARTLRVQLADGSLLEYASVSADFYRRFLQASSPWSFYRDNVEENFGVRRIR